MSKEDHEYYKRLLMALVDGELSKENKELETHLEKCSQCAQELKEFDKMREVMKTMKFKDPPEEFWEQYWTRIYNRLERGLGWILTSIGAIILLFYGGFKAVEQLVKDPTLALTAKVGILVLLAGVVVLFVSVLRERIFTYKRDKYSKEVKR